MLTRRDERLLGALARFRVARTDDLAALFFRGVRRDTAAVRLRKLHDAGFIEARPVGLHDQNVYQLGPEGRAWAEDRGIAAGAPPAAPALHHVAIVQLWARLAMALADDPLLRLVHFEPDWELRARLAGVATPVVPDAAIVVGRRQAESSLRTRVALEVDLSTERAGTLRRKLAAYEVSACFGGDGPVELAVVLFGARARRVAAVTALLGSLWSGSGFVATEREWPEALLRRLRDAPLGSSPCGKGRDEAAGSSHASPSGDQGEGPSRFADRIDGGLDEH